MAHRGALRIVFLFCACLHIVQNVFIKSEAQVWLIKCCAVLLMLHYRYSSFMVALNTIVVASYVALFSKSHRKNGAVVAWPEQRFLSTARSNGCAILPSHCTFMRQREILRIATLVRWNISASVLLVWLHNTFFLLTKTVKLLVLCLNLRRALVPWKSKKPVTRCTLCIQV